MADRDHGSIEDRVERLEALIKRVLSLQQFDDLTIGPALVAASTQGSLGSLLEVMDDPGQALTVVNRAPGLLVTAHMAADSRPPTPAG